MLYKILWILRAILYKPFFGKFDLPSYIGRPIFLFGINKIFIGKRVRIFPNVRLEVHGSDSSITIKDNVAIGQNVHITSGENLIIGESTTILANVFITNIDHDYKEINKHILNQKMIIRKTVIGDNCFIGIGAAIQAGSILGKQCIVGANSVVRGEFPDYCVIVGSPAKIIKKFNFKTQNWEKIKD
ncbi:acyltransferase [Elizabethkingia anophelis]|uniref:acyltransferase n=1 Tax=Elizabethkingia anophelis TaxID=1117645 RepID=UPI0021A27FEB|nr:acyltransferase [Elizabethkingia anophelis]MCT3977722.1 acyltransferase [Elizabethkingia anophelis]MCT4041337.1 acyltransferase [Elizabethkingia anophelis]MCT4174033.1 acyltransferase [Elizabethkingia anophelis]MCT4177714.1 acyltransferase [Elizabethkingia anophelis]